MSTYLMKPYSQNNLTTQNRIFNYQLSRARRLVENVLGILCNHFRVFMTPIALSPAKVEIITLASCILHNYLRIKSRVYTPVESMENEDVVTHQVILGNSRKDSCGNGMQPIDHQGSNNYSSSAKGIRDGLCTYYNSAGGAVPWQNDMI